MKLNGLDLNKLLVFRVVAESDGYSQAGEALGLSRSALSQSISSLERSLNLALFHRAGRKLVLSDHGRILLGAVRESQALLETALIRLDPKREAVQREIRIGAHVEFARVYLVPALRRFQREQPNVTLKFIFEAPTRMRSLLEKGKLGAVFSIEAFRGRKGIRSIRVLDESMLLVAPAEWLRADSGFQDILKFPLIDYYANHQLVRKWLEFHFRKRLTDLKIDTFAATAEMVLAMITARLGIGVVPDYMLDRNVTSSDPWQSDLTVLRPSRRQLKDHIWMTMVRESASEDLLLYLLECVQGSSPSVINEA